jgi:hypothetical protein
LYRFQWVFCQLETLRHSFPQNLRRVLEELSKSLDETYERLLKCISEDNREYACRLLHCLTVAIRPLRVDELAEILARSTLTRAREAYRNLEGSGICCAVHVLKSDLHRRQQRFSGRAIFSFFCQELLMSNRLAMSQGYVSRYDILPGPAHTILARVCLGFLLHLGNHLNVKNIKGRPLAKYAAQHWVAHSQFEGVASRVKLEG